MMRVAAMMNGCLKKEGLAHASSSDSGAEDVQPEKRSSRTNVWTTKDNQFEGGRLALFFFFFCFGELKNIE